MATASLNRPSSVAVSSLASIAFALLLLAPIAGIVYVVTGSAFAGFLAALATWLAWNWFPVVLLAVITTAPVLRSWNNTLIPPAVIAGTKTAVALMLGLIWLSRLAITREKENFPRWMRLFFVAWICLSALAFAHSTDYRISTNYLMLVASGVALFCVSFGLDWKKKHMVLSFVLLFGGLMGCLVILQYAVVVYHVGTFLTRFIIEPRTQTFFAANVLPAAAGRYRPSGTMFQPNAMGLYFALLIPFGTALLSVRSLSHFQRWIFAASTLLMLVGLYQTNSRAAALFLAVTLAYMGWHAGFRWLIALGMAMLLGGTFFVALSSSREALLERISEKARVGSGLSGRTLVWANTLDLVHESPYLGIGPGNFSRQYVSRFGYFLPNDALEQQGQIWAIQTLGEQVVDNFHSHNIYLQLMGEIGLGGPLLFLVGCILVLIHGERISRLWPQGSLAWALGVATASGALGMLVYGFFESQLGFTIGGLNLVAGPLLAIGLNPVSIYTPAGGEDPPIYSHA